MSGFSPYKYALDKMTEAFTARARSGGYSESLERDSKGIVKPAVALGICEEFPTAWAVQAELERRFDYLAQKYALPNGDRWTGEGAIREPFNGDVGKASTVTKRSGSNLRSSR